MKETATAVLDAPTAEQIIPVKRSDLLVAPWNARKTFDETTLAELTASIQQHGIRNPLLVRPLKKPGKFEIVAGHRRNLGAERAGIVEVPCIVRTMTDDEAREIGLIDNLQRVDLHPLEEAAAYGELMSAPGATIEAIAAKLGKAASHVARRLRLLGAADEVKNALRAGAVEIGHALELARLDPAQQLKLLQRMNVVEGVDGDAYEEEDENDFDAEMSDEQDDESADDEKEEKSEPTTRWRQTSMSVAELRRVIGQTTLRVLSNAPFPLEDEIPPMACTECPKRSTNATLLFSDIAQDTCTDRSCFDGKIRAWIRYSLEKAEELKKPLLMLSDRYSSEKSVIQRWDVTIIDGDKVNPCDSQEQAIWIDGDQAGHLVSICRDVECKVHRSSSKSRGDDPVARKKSRKALLAKLNASKRYRKALFAAIGMTQVGEPLVDQLSVDVALYCIERMSSIYNGKLAEALGWDDKLFGYGSGEKLRKKLATLSPVERLRAASMASHVGDFAVYEHAADAAPKGFESLAKILGIDAKPLRVEAAKQRDKKTATTAKPVKAAKLGPKKATKPEPKKTPKKVAAKKPVAKTTTKKPAKAAK